MSDAIFYYKGTYLSADRHSVYVIALKKQGKDLFDMDQMMEQFTEENGGWDIFEWEKPRSVPGDSIEKVSGPV